MQGASSHWWQTMGRKTLSGWYSSILILDPEASSVPVCFTAQAVTHFRQPSHFSQSTTRAFAMVDLPHPIHDRNHSVDR
jgi:hypothetical protein